MKSKIYLAVLLMFCIASAGCANKTVGNFFAKVHKADTWLREKLW